MNYTLTNLIKENEAKVDAGDQDITEQKDEDDIIREFFSCNLMI